MKALFYGLALLAWLPSAFTLAQENGHCCTQGVSVVTKSDGVPPVAEWDSARVVLMHTPGEELFCGVANPAAGLFENYFDVDQAAREHHGYMDVLRRSGARVIELTDVLRQLPRQELEAAASAALAYDGSRLTGLTADSLEAYRRSVIRAMSADDLIRCLLYQPVIELYPDSINTGVMARYILRPLMNLYFMRDQSITTPRGTVICRMNSVQRYPETRLLELCYRGLGITPIYRISGEGSRLEGGDYIPFGTLSFIGSGLRTNQGAIDELLRADAIGHDTLVVVHDRWRNQYQMHLDTYFNVIDRDLCTLCFNRYDARPGDDQYLTVTVYARRRGTRNYHTVRRYEGMAFTDFLRKRGMDIIRVSQSDADHYANNYLCLSSRHIAAVAGQSEEYARDLADHGVTVEWVPLSTLTQGYGAAHCMTQVIRRAGK